MKINFAVHENHYFSISEKAKEQVGEIITSYSGQYRAMETIELAKAKNLRIVFDLPIALLIHKELKLIAKELNELRTIYPNMAFRITEPLFQLARMCPGTFLNSNFAAKTKAEVMALVNSNINEVYVTGSLAADIESLKIVRQFAKIRMIPNVVQADAYTLGNPYPINPLCGFWLRPEAVDLYEGVVNTYELITSTDKNEIGLIEFYTSRKFDGYLGQIIIDETGVLDDIYSDYDEILDKTKISCGLSCQHSNRCHACQMIAYQSRMRQAEKKK